MASHTSMKYPTNQDLIAQIKFDPEHGKIWLQEQRMLLIHRSLFTNLRRELIKTLGSSFTRVRYWGTEGCPQP